MGGEWLETTIGEFCPFAYGKNLPDKKREKGPYQVYGSNGPVGSHNKPLVENLGIVIGRKGTVGAIHYAAQPFWPIDTTFYVTEAEHRDLRFTYYLLKSLGLEHMNADSAVPGLNRDAAHARKILVPRLDEQRAIAHILGTLDDKIELNRQMNRTLEAMAQALFKSWFIDFDPVVVNALRAGNPIPEKFAQRAAHYHDNPDALHLPEDTLRQFPDRFRNSELGPIPEGWEVKSLFELFELIGGGTPKTSVPEYWNGDIPWFSVVDAPNTTDVFVIDTEKHITQLGLEKSSTKILPVGTTIISARGTVGKCALVGVPMAMNQSCYGIQGREGVSDAFTYYTIRFQVSDLQRSGHGSVFNTITRETFKSITIPFSDKNLTLQFEGFVNAFMWQILHNLFQIDTLAKLRDTLLPKLISGELRVPDAEKLLEDTL